MSRFASAAVAFALASVFICTVRVLPEFAVQLHDPNLLGGVIFAWLLHVFGYAFVCALCAVLAGATVLLVAWRTRCRGANDWHAGLAAILAALCLVGRFGVSLDPIGWTAAAAICLLAERDDVWSRGAVVAIVALWSVLQGGATLGALIVLVAAMFDRRKAAAAVLCAIAAAVQLHAMPWHAYGAHALYLDALWPGAQRDRIWNGGITMQTFAFCALFVLAAWYGVRRRGQGTDAPLFFALFLLALADARNLPYFGIVAAPIVADSIASYYLNERAFPLTSIRSHIVTFAAAASAFAATLVVFEPKVSNWPPPAASSVPLLLQAAIHDARPHRVLCIQPRWCDDLPTRSLRVSALLDDRAGLATRAARATQADVDDARGAWRSELGNSGVDVVVARRNDGVVALLTSTGWRIGATDADRVVLRREQSL